MNTLTKNEKYAIVNILSQIMKADGIIHPKEEEFMDKVYSDLGITDLDLSGYDHFHYEYHKGISIIEIDII